MNFSGDEAGYLAGLARQPAARQPASIGEIWSSEWRRGGIDTIGGLAAPYGEAADELSRAIEAETGRPIAEYAQAQGVQLLGAASISFDADELRKLALTLPADSQKKIEPLIDVRLAAARKAQKIEADAADVANATYGLSGLAVAFLAGVARQSVDPVNIGAMVATAPMGGKGGAGVAALAKFAGREALANAAAQAAVEPIIEPQRAQLGLEAGFGRAAVNIAEAGIGGGILGGLFHAAGRGLRVLRGERPAEPIQSAAPDGAIETLALETRAVESGIAPEARPDPAPAGPLSPAGPVDQFAPDDFQAAAHLAERNQVIDAMSPIDTPEGRIEHADAVERTVQTLEQQARRDPPIDPSDIVTTAVTPKKPRGRASADPATFSLNEHLASIGGLAPDPELAAIYGSARGPFVPGFGPLIRKGGRSIDDALRSAKEAGYLFDPHDVDNGTAGSTGRVGLGLIQRDLLDLLDAENRGRKVYRTGRQPEAKFDDGREEHEILSALDKELFETSGGEIAVDPVIGRRVVEIVRKEGETDVLAAYERAIMEDAERYEGLAAARSTDAELAKIEGWDPDEPGAASGDGAVDPQQRRQAERAGQGDGGKDGGAARASGEGTGASRELGDPALAADAARALEDAGGDFEITLQNPDGTTRTVKASDALREVEDDARAADELNACIVRAAEEEPPF